MPRDEDRSSAIVACEAGGDTAFIAPSRDAEKALASTKGMPSFGLLFDPLGHDFRVRTSWRRSSAKSFIVTAPDNAEGCENGHLSKFEVVVGKKEDVAQLSESCTQHAAASSRR